jgi:hypothetical protein
MPEVTGLAELTGLTSLCSLSLGSRPQVGYSGTGGIVQSLVGRAEDGRAVGRETR